MGSFVVWPERTERIARVCVWFPAEWGLSEKIEIFISATKGPLIDVNNYCSLTTFDNGAWSMRRYKRVELDQRLHAQIHSGHFRVGAALRRRTVVDGGVLHVHQIEIELHFALIIDALLDLDHLCVTWNNFNKQQIKISHQKTLTRITVGCRLKRTNNFWRPIFAIGWSTECKSGKRSCGEAGRCCSVFSQRRRVTQ